MNYISPVSSECTRKSPPHMTVEQFHLLRSLILSSWVPIPNLQEVQVTSPKPCDANQKYTIFLFLFQLLLPINQKLLIWNMKHGRRQACKSGGA